MHKICYSSGSIFSLIAFVFLCLIIGVISSSFMQESLINWYPSLIKSPLTPPNSIFGPVWTVLYTMMGLSFWLIWERRENPFFVNALLLFVIGLLFNYAWTFFFFYLENPLLAFIDILALDLTILISLWIFYAIRPLAAVIYFPYFLWLLFATYLNGYIMLANSPTV